jgi:hypothetical protein
MTARRSCTPAPGPLEDYAAQFDSVFHSLAQRHSFRTYLGGLLAPRQRNKTLTALAGAEPLVQAQAAAVQQLQFSCPSRIGMPLQSPLARCHCSVAIL